MELRILSRSDLAPGEMREIEAAGEKILIARTADGDFHAVSAMCPHYHMPLCDGLLHGHTLRCAWHQACFDLRSGQTTQPPALADLQRYPVRIEGDDLYVTLPAQTPAKTKLSCSVAKLVKWASRPLQRSDAEEKSPVSESCASPSRQHGRDARVTNESRDRAKLSRFTEEKTFVILGGGAAGTAAAFELRRLGFGGRVIMVSADSHPPYDRPCLTKNYLAGQPLDGDFDLHPASAYAEAQIELLLNQRALSIDLPNRAIRLEQGDALRFDRLLIATGASAKRPEIPGGDLPHVLTMRTKQDADALIAASAGVRSIAIVGASFIGMESAAALTRRGVQVTVITPDSQPMQRVLGAKIGGMFREVHETHGVRFRTDANIASIDPAAVSLSDGTRIDAQLVLFGIGVSPVTEFCHGSLDDHREPDGGLRVDEHFHIRDGIFAAGDVACFPERITGTFARIEHWRLAEQQGRIAAANMLGQRVTFDDVPYFWTFQFDIGLDYVGHAGRRDDIITDGDIGAQDFISYFLSGGRITAAAGCGRSRQMSAFAEVLRSRGPIDAADVRRGAVDWEASLASRCAYIRQQWH